METRRVQGTLIRQAGPEDAKLLCQLMYELAEYEGVPDSMGTTPEGLRRAMADPKGPEAILCETDDSKREPVGFGIYAYSFSSFTGKLSVYIDDLYVREEYRGKGIGSALFSCVARIASERGCGRVDWYCMKTNTEGQAYYDQVLMADLVDWIMVYRLEEEALRSLGEKAPGVNVKGRSVI